MIYDFNTFLINNIYMQLQAEVKEKSKKNVQMPPIVPLRNDLKKVLEVDKDIIGYDNSKFVFTDITFGVSDKVNL